MASFRQRKSGYWQAIIRRENHPQQSKTFALRVDAERWARDIENKMDRGVFVSTVEAESTTLANALERYEREVSRQKKGYEQERYRIRAWAVLDLAKKSLAGLRGADFAKYRDDRLTLVSPATVRLELALISHVFAIANKEWGIPVANPVANIRLPRVANARERRLEPAEETALLKELEAPAGDRSNIWIRPVIVLALETAMRQGELLSLRWENVDLRRRTARLPDTKNGTARDVPLSNRAVAVLEALPRSIDGRVFATTESALKQSWVRAVKRAEIEGLHFHDLRHEATSRLAEKLALHELMKVTGHKDTRMLARYYHPRAEDLAKKLG